MDLGVKHFLTKPSIEKFVNWGNITSVTVTSRKNSSKNLHQILCSTTRPKDINKNSARTKCSWLLPTHMLHVYHWIIVYLYLWVIVKEKNVCIYSKYTAWWAIFNHFHSVSRNYACQYCNTDPRQQPKYVVEFDVDTPKELLWKAIFHWPFLVAWMLLVLCFKIKMFADNCWPTLLQDGAPQL